MPRRDVCLIDHPQKHHGARAGLDELDAIPEREVLGQCPYGLAAYADLHPSLKEAGGA